MLASALTATAGFAVLIVSDVTMLRDFGIVTVIDLSVALLGVMVALPAALVALERAVRDRYSILVGLLFVAVVVIAVLNGTGGGGGTLGLDRQPSHWPLPEFAVPRADSTLEGDANVAQDDCETSQLPCPPDARRTPACRVDDAGAIRVCDLFDRPSVISFWFTKGGGCVDQQDAVSDVYERYRGRVGFLSLDVRDDRGSVRDLIRERGWQMPVGFDRDGAVAGALPGRRLPDLRLRLPGRHPAERQHRRPHRRPARRQGRGAARAPPAAAEGGGPELKADQGWVAPHLAAEFPGLGIASVTVDGGPGPSPEGVRRRLRELSDRFYGSHAIRLRERPIPWAYRVFFRQIGLDPDRTRTPVEELALERLHDGAFKSRGLPEDALNIAIVETGVALRVFDGEQVGRLSIRDTAPGEKLPERGGRAGRRARW